MATLSIVPSIPERPAHLIRVAVPRLNKQDHIEDYIAQLETRDYDTTWAQVDETVILSIPEWNELMHGLLTDRAWLAGKGGCSSWAFPAFENDDKREFFQLSAGEQQLWRDCSYIHVVAVGCGIATIFIDPQGYDYARYVGFSADERPEGKTREEIRREEQKRDNDRKAEELRHAIENPPEVPDDHGLRFVWNGIKAEGKLYRAWYSIGGYKRLGVDYPEGTIGISARDYESFPESVRKCFRVENNSDSQSDYFDNDHIRVTPNHALYSLVKAAHDAAEEHFRKAREKRVGARATSPR